MKEINILVILEHNPFANSSAQNNRFLSLAKGLQNNGVKLKLLFIGGYRNINEIERFENEGINKGFKYRYLNKKKQISSFKRKINKLFTRWAKIKKEIIEDLIQNEYNFVWIGVSSRVIQLWLKLDIRNIPIKIFHERSEFSWHGFKNVSFHRKYMDEFLPTVDIFSVMTITLKDYYLKFLKKTCNVIHLPMTVDLDRFNFENCIVSYEKPYIGYCGTMNNKKDGVNILIRAFITIMNDFPDYKLYLAGSFELNEDTKIQKRFIDESGAQKRIKYIGYLDREKIPAFLQNAGILVMARPYSKQSEGGFPTKLGEYLATGNPICVTRVGEISDYLVDEVSAYFAEPNSVNSFAKAMRKALTQQNAKTVGNNGKVVAYKYFNKDKQAKELYLHLKDELS